MKKILKTWWCACGPRFGNFGDKLTKTILEHFTDYEIIQHDRKKLNELDMIGVGSILHVAKGDNFSGKIWTTGFMHEYHKADFNKCQIIGVRGKLTLDRIKCRNKENVIVGDGGLLCDSLPVPEINKKYVLGIIPHYVDFDNELINHMINSDPNIVKIDICNDTLKVIESVKECEFILSSCLHGLILSDSLNIPNDWIKVSENVHGNGFKFRDHYSIFKIKDKLPYLITRNSTLLEITKHLKHYNRPGIERIKENLKKSIKMI